MNLGENVRKNVRINVGTNIWENVGTTVGITGGQHSTQLHQEGPGSLNRVFSQDQCTASAARGEKTAIAGNLWIA